jgi:preprotein translocase subunit SecG
MQATMYILMTLFVIISLFLILLILIQKGRGGGLSGAFGGAGGNTAFGSKTGDVLTWATSIVFGVFLLLAILLNLLANHMVGSTATAAVIPAIPAPTTAPTGGAALPANSLPADTLPAANLPGPTDFSNTSNAPFVPPTAAPVTPAPSTAVPTAPAAPTTRP